MTNVFLTNKTDVIEPLVGDDGYPPEDMWPATLEDYTNLSNASILAIAKYYDLLPPDEKEANELAKQLDIKNHLESGLITAKQDYTQKEVDEIYDTLAKYLGLRVRKNKKLW